MDYETRDPDPKDMIEAVIDSLETIAVLKPITWDDLVFKNAERLTKLLDKL